MRSQPWGSGLGVGGGAWGGGLRAEGALGTLGGGRVSVSGCLGVFRCRCLQVPSL